MKKLILGTGRLLQLPLFAAALLCYLSAWISPASFWPVHFFGLAYPIIFILLAGFTVAWLLVEPKLAWLPVLAILGGMPFFSSSIGLANPFSRSLPAEAIPNKNEGFTLLTYNVQGFARHVSFTGAEKQRRLDAFFEFFTDDGVEVICAQEFIHNKFGKELLRMLDKAGYTYRHHFHNRVIILSKYPILSGGGVDFKVYTNGTAFADIKVGQRVVRVYNTHLQSIKFDNKDYENIESGSPQKPGLIRIARKLKRAAVVRSEQVDQLSAHMAQSPHPTIVVGDFNESPSNYAYSTLSRGKRDAFLANSFQRPGTYAGPIPGLRIDFLLVDQSMRTNGYHVIRNHMSDHFPVRCRVWF
ncbi:MAG: endonuclease/exonuclease/phosphatase family protein [Bacteroidota bacterium]